MRERKQACSFAPHKLYSPQNSVHNISFKKICNVSVFNEEFLHRETVQKMLQNFTGMFYQIFVIPEHSFQPDNLHMVRTMSLANGTLLNVLSLRGLCVRGNGRLFSLDTFTYLYKILLWEERTLLRRRMEKVLLTWVLLRSVTRDDDEWDKTPLFNLAKVKACIHFQHTIFHVLNLVIFVCTLIWFSSA